MWHLFATLCYSQSEDPQRCGIGSVLFFLQEGLEKQLSTSTLMVYMAAIAANHDTVGARSLGKHNLIVKFLRGVQRLNPPK